MSRLPPTVAAPGVQDEEAERREHRQLKRRASEMHKKRKQLAGVETPTDAKRRKKQQEEVHQAEVQAAAAAARAAVEEKAARQVRLDQWCVGAAPLGGSHPSPTYNHGAHHSANPGPFHGHRA